jgi:hypothetical protein
MNNLFIAEQAISREARDLKSDHWWWPTHWLLCLRPRVIDFIRMMNGC